MWLWYLLIFIFGTIIGSFLNVLIIRYNTGKSLAGRSGCLACGRQLTALDLVPILSYLSLKGRCRECQSHISLQYPIVEVLTGLLFVLTVWRFFPNFNLIAFYWLIMALVVIIGAYDWRHQIIPTGPMYILIALSLIWAVANGGAYLLAGLGSFAFFAFLWAVSGGRWMGFGDAKLGLALGWLLGPVATLSALALAFWSGALVGIGLMVASRLKRLWWGSKLITIKSELPFAPFMILGLLMVLFFSWHVIPF
ncbi:MAG: prepilin peptidase [Candidatus Vogelbacteria bacterium]|nr:prepilin peptidase [Candidatus Vogelbacteria bacterium]